MHVELIRVRDIREVRRTPPYLSYCTHYTYDILEYHIHICHMYTHRSWWGSFIPVSNLGNDRATAPNSQLPTGGPRCLLGKCVTTVSSYIYICRRFLVKHVPLFRSRDIVGTYDIHTCITTVYHLHTMYSEYDRIDTISPVAVFRVVMNNTSLS